MPKKKRKKVKKNKPRGPASPNKAKYPGLPPKTNLGRCKKCKRVLGVCLIEISRTMPSSAIVMQRAYGCRNHAAEIAEGLVKEMATWTTWLRDEDVDGIEDADATVVETFEEVEVLDKENDDGQEE